MVAQKKRTDRRPSRTDTMGKKIRFCPKTSCIQKISTIPANVSNYCTKTIGFEMGYKIGSFNQIRFLNLMAEIRHEKNY